MWKFDPDAPQAETAVLERYLRGLQLRYDGKEMIQRGNDLRAEGAHLIERARDAADLLGFDVEDVFDKWVEYHDRLKAEPTAEVIGPPMPLDLNAAPPMIGREDDARPTVREFILTEAEAAAPNAVRAADLRRKFEEKYGLTVHEKTFGMSLYRLSQHHFMRREGHADWFFVPEHARPPKQPDLDFDEGKRGRRLVR